MVNVPPVRPTWFLLSVSGCLSMKLGFLLVLTHTYTLALPRCRTKSYSNSIFPRTASLWNSLPGACFPPSYNLDCFKRNINSYLQLPWVIFTFNVFLLVAPYQEWLLALFGAILHKKSKNKIKINIKQSFCESLSSMRIVHHEEYAKNHSQCFSENCRICWCFLGNRIIDQLHIKLAFQIMLRSSCNRLTTNVVPSAKVIVRNCSGAVVHSVFEI